MTNLSKYMTQKLLVLFSILAFCLGIVSCSSSNSTAATSEAIKELRKMSGAVEMGLSLEEYTKRIIDMKAEVEENLSQISDGQLKEEIKASLQAYIDAKTLWNSSVEPKSSDSSSVYQAVFKKYDLPGEYDPDLMKDSKFRSLVMSIIWLTAKKHIEKAEELNGKK